MRTITPATKVTKAQLTKYLRAATCPYCGGRLSGHHVRSEDGWRSLPMAYRCTICSRNPREALADENDEPAGRRAWPEGEGAMSKKTQKTNGKKNGGNHNDPAPNAAKIEATPRPPDDASEIVVFAFRLSRAERDEIHAATGSAKASKFIRTLALAGARGDMKAVQETIDEVHATSK
jgi:DNA-directed RNA polymerase subunit RPC12/RpoP